jgi:ankyrin repeat protein
MLRATFLVLIAFLMLPIAACNLQIGNTETIVSTQPDVETPEGAREKLANLNIPYSVDQFVRSARESDIVAVRLFLNAGMKRDAKDSNGVTALEAATRAGNSKIVKILEEADTEKEEETTGQ